MASLWGFLPNATMAQTKRSNRLQRQLSQAEYPQRYDVAGLEVKMAKMLCDVDRMTESLG